MRDLTLGPLYAGFTVIETAWDDGTPAETGCHKVDHTSGVLGCLLKWK